MNDDKCPVCGAPVDRDIVAGRRYACGSVAAPSSTRLCYHGSACQRIKELEAALKAATLSHRAQPSGVVMTKGKDGRWSPCFCAECNSKRAEYLDRKEPDDDEPYEWHGAD